MVKLLRVALPVEQLRCRRIILRRPQSTCVRLELHCVQPLHLPEIQRLLLLAVSAEGSTFQKHLRRTGLSARQAEMTASRQVDGVCPGVKAEFCLRPLLALRRKLAHPVPQLKQKARPVFRLVKRLPGRLDCWVSVKQFSKNDTATACQDWLRSTRLGRGSIKSHVRTVKVLGMGLFAFQERIHLWKGVTH